MHVFTWPNNQHLYFVGDKSDFRARQPSPLEVSEVGVKLGGRGLNRNRCDGWVAKLTIREAAGRPGLHEPQRTPTRTSNIRAVNPQAHETKASLAQRQGQILGLT